MRNFIDILNGTAPEAETKTVEIKNSTFREVGRLYESSTSTDDRLKNMKDGDEVQIDGFKIVKLPDTADFAYAVSKDGYEEKFYSAAKVMEYLNKDQ